MAEQELWDTISKLCAWLDTAENKLDGDVLKLVRVMKIQEEAGEVAQATIGALGQNVRKGQITHTWEDVSHEIVDVAITALVALASVLPATQAREMFEERLAYIAKRAGVSN